MKYRKIIKLKNGEKCCLRNGTESDGQLVLDNFNLTLQCRFLFHPIPPSVVSDITSETVD